MGLNLIETIDRKINTFEHYYGELDYLNQIKANFRIDLYASLLSLRVAVETLEKKAYPESGVAVPWAHNLLCDIQKIVGAE